MSARCRRSKRWRNGEARMAGARIVVKIQVGDMCISVPYERATIDIRGLFVSDLHLPEGAPVVIELCKGQDKVTLSGVVCASYRDLGLAIQFKEKTDHAVRRLAALLAA